MLFASSAPWPLAGNYQIGTSSNMSSTPITQIELDAAAGDGHPSVPERKAVSMQSDCPATAPGQGQDAGSRVRDAGLSSGGLYSRQRGSPHMGRHNNANSGRPVGQPRTLTSDEATCILRRKASADRLLMVGILSAVLCWTALVSAADARSMRNVVLIGTS